MDRPRIAVFTAWPDLVKDKNDFCDVIVQDQTVEQLMMATFENINIDHGLKRLAVRVHDRNLYPEYQYVLFVKEPIEIDVQNLWDQIDLAHTSFVCPDNTFIFYRRDKIWSEKQLQIFPQPVGIIFIDCWQTLHENSSWPCQAENYNFFINMKQTLDPCQAKSLVFHTGTFGDFPLATELKSWHRQGNVIDLIGDHDAKNWQLDYFKLHYNNRKLYNWIVVGAHWQRCTHDKPLGLHNLLQLKRQDPRLRIFTHMDCVAKFINNDIDHPELTTLTSRDFEQENLKWRPNGKLPELIGPL